MYTFPNLWHNITYFAGWFNILLYMIMILLVTNEYIYKTLRQNIIDGLSKAEVLLGKLLLGAAFSLYSTLLIVVVGLVTSYLFAPDSFQYELIIQKLDFIGAYFLQTLGYMTFAIFISFLLKRQGFSIIFFLIYITMLENIVALKLPPNVSKYLPIEMFGNLILNPFSTYINGYTQNSIDPSYIVISILYIFIFSGITLLMLEKTDI
ncbi:hypothetical protein EON78_06995 [bacterium]|nr:MAG: hypothetical protein EON78_06995 [bacterium]